MTRLTILLLLLIPTLLSGQTLLAYNNTSTSIENNYTNPNSEEEPHISLNILSNKTTSHIITIEFEVESRGLWMVQIADMDDTVLYQQTGSGKGLYEMDINTRRYTKGEYQIVVWSNEEYVIKKMVVD